MIICPMCEHQQAQGIECEVCGKKLAAVAPVAVVVAPIPELELTQVAGSRAPVPAVAAIPDLELTRQQSVASVPVQPVPELDTGRSSAAALNVAVAPVQDMDSGRAEQVGVKTAAPLGAVVCRYCRNIQETGAVCDRCGMRLPKLRMTTPEAAAAPVEAGERTRCPRCHTPAHAGRACITCGTLVPAAD